MLNPEKKSCDYVSRQSTDALFGGDCSHFLAIVRLVVSNDVCRTPAMTTDPRALVAICL